MIELTREQINNIKSALTQSRFCLKELLPDDNDAKLTIEMINNALKQIELEIE